MLLLIISRVAGYWRKASRNGRGEELKTPALDRLRLQGRKTRSRSDAFQVKTRAKLAMTLKSLWRDFPRRRPCLQARGVILGRWGWLSCEVRVKVGRRQRKGGPGAAGSSSLHPAPSPVPQASISSFQKTYLIQKENAIFSFCTLQRNSVLYLNML